MVSSCIALSIYSNQTREAALAHLITNDPNVHKYLKYIRRMFKGQDFTVNIVSPRASLVFREGVKGAVKRHFNVSIGLGEIDPIYCRYDVSLDISTGQVIIEKRIR